MSEFIEIHWTCSTIDEARKVGRSLVEQRLVACIQIIPWIESIYIWNNELETTQESKVVVKTHHKHLQKVTEFILKNSSYEVPEIIYFNIEGGNDAYMEWMHESTFNTRAETHL